MSEVIEVFIPHVKLKVGLLKSTPYHLIVTNERLLMIQNTKAVQKAAQQRLLQTLKGKSMKERMLASLSMNSALAQHYENLGPEGALLETPGNHAYPRHTLIKVRTSIGAGYDENNRPTSGTITLTTTTGKLVFKGATTEDGERAYHALKKALF